MQVGEDRADVVLVHLCSRSCKNMVFKKLYSRNCIPEIVVKWKRSRGCRPCSPDKLDVVYMYSDLLYVVYIGIALRYL